MLYISTFATLNPETNTTFYNSAAGTCQGQIPHLGIEANSSLMRGYLHAVLDGLAKLENLRGTGHGEVVTLLIPDLDIAAKVRAASETLFGKLISYDNKDLWQQLLARKKQFNLHVVSFPDEATDLTTLWQWQKPGYAFGSAREVYNNAPVSV